MRLLCVLLCVVAYVGAQNYMLGMYFTKELLDNVTLVPTQRTCLRMQLKETMTNVKEDKSVDAKYSIAVDDSKGNNAYHPLRFPPPLAPRPTFLAGTRARNSDACFLRHAMGGGLLGESFRLVIRCSSSKELRNSQGNFKLVLICDLCLCRLFSYCEFIIRNSRLQFCSRMILWEMFL